MPVRFWTMRLLSPRIALFALAIALTLQPVAADGVWWHAARGRAVLGGETAPSAALLGGDEQAEADWLGGVPWCLLFTGLGPSGLMLARVIGIGFALAVCLFSPAAGVPAVRITAASAAALVAASPSFDPIESWWDLIAGWLAVGWCTTTEPSRPAGLSDDTPVAATGWRDRILSGAGRRALGTIAIALAWANLGPRSLLSLAMAGRKRAVLLLIAATLCLTPRGLWGPLDSMLTLVPVAALHLYESGGTSWLSGYSIAGPAPEPIQLLAWLALAATALAGRRDPVLGVRGLVAWIGLQFLVVANPSSLPALTPWAWWLATGVHHPHVSGAPPRSPACCPSDFHRVAWAAVTAAAIWFVALGAATGPWPGLPWRLGWGVSPRLEYRQLVEPLEGGGAEGTSFAFDERAAGMLLWAHPTGPPPWLVPHRALLTGRFIAEATRSSELRAGWDMQQRTPDGSWGGWWVPLMQRGTRLIVVARDDVDTMRRLEPGIFKPLVIDAPVVPYAVAGDRRQTGAILQAVADRDVVEDGGWTFTLPHSIQTDWSHDLWGFVSGRPDPRSFLAQADVFLALHLPRAALKILLPVSHAGLADCTTRIAAATLQLAERERLALGKPTAFRAAVLRELGIPPAPASGLARGMAPSPGRPRGDATRDEILPRTSELVATYLDAGAAAALASAPGGGLEDEWTRAMLALESGRPALARAILDRQAAGDGIFAAAALDLLDALPVAEEPR